MKHSTKSKRTAPQPASNAASPKRWIVSATCLVFAAAGSWAFAEFVVWNKLPADLVGKWVVEGGEQDGATFDFYRSGKMLGRINLSGREGIIEANVEVEGGQLRATTRNPRTGAMETRTQTIVQRTNSHLVLRDDRGNV